MNIVFFTSELRPVAVIDLPLWAIKQGERLGDVTFSVTPPSPQAPTSFDLACEKFILRFRRIRIDGRESRVVIVESFSLALRLRSDEQRQIVVSLTKMLLESRQGGRDGE